MAKNRQKTPPTNAAAATPPPAVSIPGLLLTLLALAYVGFVLLADIYLQHFVPRPMFFGADLFKFTTWFLIPFLVCVWRMDWQWFGIRRWQRIDYYLFAIVIVLEMLAVLCVHFLPALRSQLPDLRGESVLRFAVWNLSWLVGWEFMHRYVLLRRLSASFPRFGWLLIPVYEGVYHQLIWSSLAMPAGMVLFSLIATYWSLKRRNSLLPFFAHFIIEAQLTLFLLFT